MNLEILKNLIKFNTIEDKENKQFIKYVSEYLSKLGFELEYVEGNNFRKCLIAKLGDQCNLCFLGHSDTVSINNDWETNPFELTIKDDFMYGRGVCDMKGGIAAFLDALSTIDISNINGLMIIITYDEEIGFEGINLVKNRDDIPENIIIGEPTDLIPIAFCKGCMEFSATLPGKAVHSALSPNGDNAIEKMYKYMYELREFEKSLEKQTNDSFTIPHTTLNISTIKGGTSINSVPDECKITFDFRTNLKAHHDFILNKVGEITNKYNGELEVITNVLPTETDVKNIKFYEEITGNEAGGMDYVTEGNFLNKENIVIIGPGPVTAHEANEHISVSSYEKTKKIYKKVIHKYCNK